MRSSDGTRKVLLVPEVDLAGAFQELQEKVGRHHEVEDMYRILEVGEVHRIEAHSQDNHSMAVAVQERLEEGIRDSLQVAGIQARELRSLGIVLAERLGEEDVDQEVRLQEEDADPWRLQLREVVREGLQGVVHVDRVEVLLPVEGTAQEEGPQGVGTVQEVHRELHTGLEEALHGVVGSGREAVGSIRPVEGNIPGEVDSNQQEEHQEEGRKVLGQA